MNERSAIEGLVLQAVTALESRADVRTDVTSIWDEKVMRDLGARRPNRPAVRLAVQRLRRRGLLVGIGTGAGMRYHLPIAERIKLGLPPNPYNTAETRKRARQAEDDAKRTRASRKWWEQHNNSQLMQVMLDALIGALPRRWLTYDQIKSQLAIMSGIQGFEIDNVKIADVLDRLKKLRIVYGSALYDFTPKGYEMYIHRAVARLNPPLPSGDWLTLRVASDPEIVAGVVAWQFRAVLGQGGEPFENDLRRCQSATLAAHAVSPELNVGPNAPYGLLASWIASFLEKLVPQHVRWSVEVVHGDHIGSWTLQGSDPH